VISLIAFAMGLVVGVLATLFGVAAEDDVVIVRGTKDSFQTVEWRDKNYRLEPLEKAAGE
jgi:hypothetical protein